MLQRRRVAGLALMALVATAHAGNPIIPNRGVCDVALDSLTRSTKSTSQLSPHRLFRVP